MRLSANRFSTNDGDGLGYVIGRTSFYKDSARRRFFMSKAYGLRAARTAAPSSRSHTLTESDVVLGIVFQRFGPYHLARLRATSRAGVRALGVQLSAVDHTYAWLPCDPSSEDTLLTVFEGEHTDEVSPRRLYRKLARVLDEANVNCLAVPGWSSPASLAALAWCRQKGVPAVVMSESTAHDEPRAWWKEAIKRRLVRQCAAGLVGGTPHAEYAAALGMRRERIFTGYDAVDNEHFAQGAAKASAQRDALRAELNLPRRYFLASSRFVDKKNLPRLLRAFALYRARVGGEAWHLVLLGDGKLRPALERQVLKAELARFVHMPGFKQYDELPAYYCLADAFVHASTTEQWGLVVNEAMAAGLPVIVSDRSGCAPDLVSRGENGFIFDPHDEEALTARMLQMSSGCCDLAAMGEASKRIISRWTPETFARNLTKAVEVALATPLRRATVLDRSLLWALARR